MTSDTTCATVCSASTSLTTYIPGASVGVNSTILFNRTSGAGEACCCEARTFPAAFLQPQRSNLLFSSLSITLGDRIWKSAEGERIIPNVRAVDYANKTLSLNCLYTGWIASSIQCVRPGNTFPPIPSIKAGSIALVGDSITRYAEARSLAGWAVNLRAAYKGKYDVINEGNPGWTTTDYLAELGPVLKRYVSPTLITLLLGTNDDVQNWPLETYRANLYRMVATVKSLHPTARFLLMTPPPPLASFDPAKMNTFRQAMLDVAVGTNTNVLDTWKVFLGPTAAYNGTTMSFYLGDFVHLNRNGNVKLLQGLTEYIETTWPEISP
ncbi:hypothetical protein PhCBS80983_g00271 [Powellomyces hirtus]|uniref:SGNH hydrolase-type esterase domain-containing protein n=1 Tax=Powellomyces hirtus TaxID=109895 RepID=A0A507EGL5_9FUNG|nr:hypothetical protein PhCBS80983_g00271 [Powellomyces hirtus]